MKRWTLPRLLEPKSITFGFTIFYFVWTVASWLREPLPIYYHAGAPDYHFNVFMAALLLVAGVGLVCNRIWGKLIAAILCGQVPLAFCLIFWLMAKDAETLPFSPAHITRCFRELPLVPIEAWLWLTISSIVLAYAAPSIIRANMKQKLALMPDGRAGLLPCAHATQAQPVHFTTHATSAGLRAHHHVGVR